MQGALKQMNAKVFMFPSSALGFMKKKKKFWVLPHDFYLSQDLYRMFILKADIKDFSNFTSCQSINPLGKCLLKLDKKTCW